MYPNRFNLNPLDSAREASCSPARTINNDGHQLHNATRLKYERNLANHARDTTTTPGTTIAEWLPESSSLITDGQPIFAASTDHLGAASVVSVGEIESAVRSSEEDCFTKRLEDAGVRKDTKKFQILDGFRRSFLYVNRPRATEHVQPHRKTGSIQTSCADPGRQELVTTLTAMEQRLSALLEDRSRIGQNLHDCILQSLYTIESNIQARRIMGPYHAIATDQPSAENITDQINGLIGEIREMIRGLNAEVVKDSCLTADLYALKSIYNEIGRVRITLDLQPAATEVLTRDEEREILNIVREALSNCVGHAHAAHATISIRRRGAKIRLHISDDGAGFAMGDTRTRGYGLASIESRARKIGGILRLHSEEGRGTQVTVEFSLEPMLAPV